MRRWPRGHQVRRAIVLGALLLVVLAATPTLAAFTGSIVANGTSEAASLVLTTSPSGGSTCYSTSGTNTPFASDSASCAGSVWPSTELSSSASASLATTFASLGTIAPTAATIANAGAGTEVATDASGAGNDAFPLAGVTFGASGPLSASAVSLDGSTGVMETEQAINDPGANLTLAAWFKVASGYASGGGIIEFQSVQSHYAGGSNDRKVWMDNSGHVCSGVYNGAANVGCSTSTYNDAGWHYVVASYSSSSGLTLYVDGTSVATNPSATSGQNYVGYWAIGYSYGAGWAPLPSSYYLNGSLAEVSVFPSSLSSAQVTTLYGGGSGSESSFETRVLADSPSAYWPLQAATSTTNLPDISALPDISGNQNLGTPQGGVTPSDHGPFGADGATYFAGTSSGWAETTTNIAALAAAYSIAVWFRAPSGLSTGGGILTDDSTQTGGGASDDPLMWMDNSGKIVAGTFAGGADREQASTAAYNDGNWHFAVMRVSAAGLKVYIDGALIGTNANGTAGGAHIGYWMIGQANGVGTWADPPTNTYWTGDLAHITYFPSALTAAQITTLDGEASVTAFEDKVLTDSPTYYWPLTDSGTSEAQSYPFFQVEPDSSGHDDPATVVSNNVTLGVPGNFAASYAASFDGVNGWLTTAKSFADPQGFSIAAWFKVANGYASGGGILAMQNLQTSTSPTDQDRQLWMDNAGHISAGVYNGATDVATSPGTYNDGNWHFAVATVSATAGLTLYVDGASVATNGAGTTAQNYTGWWVIDYVNTSGWAPTSTSDHLKGSIEDVAVIPSVLTAANVTTLNGKASQAAFSTSMLSFSPSAYWTLADPYSAPTDAGAVEMSLQAVNNATTTCLFPAGAGSCPALSESDFVPTTTSWTPTAPTAAHATTATLSAEEASAAPTAFSGLHFIAPFTFAGTNGSSWTASLAYLTANLEL